jgi:hypothetical protein
MPSHGNQGRSSEPPSTRTRSSHRSRRGRPSQRRHASPSISSASCATHLLCPYRHARRTPTCRRHSGRANPDYNVNAKGDIKLPIPAHNTRSVLCRTVHANTATLTCLLPSMTTTLACPTRHTISPSVRTQDALNFQDSAQDCPCDRTRPTPLPFHGDYARLSLPFPPHDPMQVDIPVAFLSPDPPIRVDGRTQQSQTSPA